MDLVRVTQGASVRARCLKLPHCVPMSGEADGSSSGALAIRVSETPLQLQVMYTYPLNMYISMCCTRCM